MDDRSLASSGKVSIALGASFYVRAEQKEG